MKVKKIEAICRAEKMLLLIPDRRGLQWIGTGAAVYPLYGFPPLDEESTYAVFDIPKDKRSKYKFKYAPDLLDDICVDDCTEDEKLLEECPIGLHWHGLHVALLIRDPSEESGEIIPINRALLSPYAGEDGWTIWERRDSRGRIYVAVKQGVSLAGIIYPLNIFDTPTVERLEQIAQLAKTMSLGGSHGT